MTSYTWPWVSEWSLGQEEEKASADGSFLVYNGEPLAKCLHEPHASSFTGRLLFLVLGALLPMASGKGVPLSRVVPDRSLWLLLDACVLTHHAQLSPRQYH